MADNENVVDTLSIQVNASAKKAIKNLTDLEDKLQTLASTVGNLSNAAGSLNRLGYALNTLSSVNVGNLSKGITQLKRLEKINFGQNVGSVTAMATQLQNLSSALAVMGSVNYKDAHIRPFVNAMEKLSTVTIDPALSVEIKNLSTAMEPFTTMKDISSNVTKFISALGKLASTGNTIRNVTVELPDFAKAIRDAATVLSQLGGVNPQITQFISSLGQLASVGNRIPGAAQNLRLLTTALRDMITALNGVNINGDVAQLVSAISTLASSLGAINGQGGGGGLRTSTQRVSLLSKGFQKLGNIASSALKKIVSLLKKVGTSVGSAFGNLIRQISGVKEASTHMFTLSDGIKSVIGGLLGMRGITGVFNWLKEAVTAGGDITEIDHIVKSVFGENMVGYVDEWADNAIDQFGIAAGAAKHYAGVLSSMFQASNITAHESGEMAMRMVELAGDLSAFYNIDTETAYNKIKSGLAGMVRPLRDLGIDLSIATLQEYALTQGITKKVSAMTQAEKVMLRYQYLLSVTGTQQGDFSRTSLSLANSLRTLRAYISAVTTQLGVGLAAALRHVVILLNAVMKRVLQLAQSFATLMQSIFGKYEGGASGIAMDLSGAEDYADGLADSVDNASSGLGDMADNAKQLAKSLSVLPFDELNQLNKDNQVNDSTTGGGTGSGGGLGDLGDLGIDDALGDIESMINNSTIPGAISKWIERIKNAFQAGNFYAVGRDAANMLNEGLLAIYKLLDPATVKEKFEPYIYAFAAAFDSFIDTFRFDLLGAVVARGINNIAYLFSTWYDLMNFERLGQQFASGLNGLLTEGDFYAWGFALGNYFMIAWDIFKGFVSNDELWHNLATAISDGIKGIAEGVRLGDIGEALALFVNGIATTLGDIAADNEMWQGVVDNIVNGINTFISTTNWKENGEKLNQFLQHFAEALADTIDGIHWEELGEGLGKTLTEIKMGDALYRLASSILTALGKFLSGLISEPGGSVALGIIGGLAALKISSSVLTLCFSHGTGALGTSIVSGIGSAVELSAPALGAMIVATIGQGILLAKNWEEIPTVTSGKITSALEKIWAIVNHPESLWRQEAINGFEKLTGTDIPDTMEKAMAYGFVSPISTAANLIGEIVPKVKELNIPEKLNEEIERSGPMLQRTASYSTALFGGSYIEGYTSNILPALNTSIAGIKAKYNETENMAETSGKNTAWRHGHGMRYTAELESSLNQMEDLVDGRFEHIKQQSPVYGRATMRDYGASFADQSELDANLSTMQSKCAATFEAIRQAAETIGTAAKNGVIHGLQTHTSGLESFAENAKNVTGGIADNVKTSLNIDMFRTGQTVGESFSNGLSSAHIATPHISVDWIDYGIMSIPQMSINWYKSGGYFRGGNGSVIGIGEGHRDEAVLPLENRKTMSMIADSIVSASNGMGLDTQDLADAIVEAMVTVNSGQQDPIFHIEVKTEDNEVLARAVTRGQRSIDYRNNPTPRFAY